MHISIFCSFPGDSSVTGYEAQIRAKVPLPVSAFHSLPGVTFFFLLATNSRMCFQTHEVLPPPGRPP